MTAALLCLAAALLAWPDPAVRRRARLGRPARPVSAWLAWPDSGLGVALAAGAGGAVGAAAGSLLVAALAAGCAALGARGWAARRRAVREEARVAALVEALGALAAELRSGRPPDAAVAAAVRADDRLGRALVGAVRLPRPVPRPAGARTGPVEQALDRVAAAVRLSARTGASLAEVVTAVEDDLRARQRLRRELHAAVAAPRASAVLLAGLPVLGLAMGNGVGADPWHVLTGTGTGQILLVAGVGLEVAGVAWSRRLVARAIADPLVP